MQYTDEEQVTSFVNSSADYYTDYIDKPLNITDYINFVFSLSIILLLSFIFEYITEM